MLGDDAKRKEYDEVRAMGPMSGMGGMGGRGAPGGFTFNVEDMGGAGGLGDLFGSMFGRGGQGRGRAGGASGVGPRRGADITAQLTVDFADAVHGLTTTLYLTTDAQCSTCNGSGARPGTVAGDVFGVRRPRCRRRQPGHVLVLVAVPRVRRPGQPHRGSLPDLSRHAGSSSANAR